MTITEQKREARLVDLADKYQSLQARLVSTKDQMEAIKREIGSIMREGSECGWTVYRVRETRVRGYTRSSYRAIRSRSLR